MRISLVARIAAWSLAAVIVVLSVVPAELRPQTPAPHAFEHFAIYWLTGLAFGLGYDRRPALLSILLVVYCGMVETAQLFVPGRHARLGDFIVDALAVCVGVTAAALVNRIGRPSSLQT